MKYMSDFIIYLYTMEKLIELLNEYQEQKGSEIRFKRIDNSDFFVCWDDVWLGYETILSKKFGFIQWLVCNKIDLEELEKELSWMWIYCNIWYYEGLLMLLSIQDNPIEFLVSILK